MAQIFDPHFGRRIRSTASAAALCCLVLLSACEWDQACNNTGDAPIAVQVRDAVDGSPAAVGASGMIQSGSFSAPLSLPAPDETLELYSAGPYGTYDVRITKNGYRDWESNGVYVPGGKCGVARTVYLKADLERNP
jgi:hypothetical protein